MPDHRYLVNMAKLYNFSVVVAYFCLSLSTQLAEFELDHAYVLIRHNSNPGTA